MSLTLEDLNGPDMEWKRIDELSYYDGIESIQSWFSHFKDTPNYNDLRNHLDTIYTCISIKTGITKDKIQTLFMEKIFTGSYRTYYTNNYYFKFTDCNLLSQIFYVPDIESYMEKKAQKTGKNVETQYLETMIQVYHNFSPAEQMVLLCLLAHYMGAGSHNSFQRSLKSYIKTKFPESADSLDNSYDKIAHTINYNNIDLSKLKQYILAMKITETSISTLIKLVEHFKKEYQKKLEYNENLVLPYNIDPNMGDLFNILHALLLFKQCLDLEKKQKLLIQEGLDLISSVDCNQSFIVDFVPNLPDSIISETPEK